MSELKRTVGRGTILAITIGSIMGTGMFIGPARGAEIAGNASLFSWIILSFISLYIGACFGELITLFPKAGGVYEFGKQTYGRFFSFIIGWLAWLVGNITTVVLIVAGVQYLLPGSQYVMLQIGISALFLVVLNLIAYMGMKGSSIMAMAFTTVSIIVILGVVIPGFFVVDTDNVFPIISKGWTPVIVTIFFIAESFFGWESASYLAEETKEPEKIIPSSLMIATIFVCILAILLAFTMLGTIPAQRLGSYDAPLQPFARIVFNNLGVPNVDLFVQAITIGVYLTLLGCAADQIITMPRLILALSRDKLFLKQFADIHPRFNTPHKAIVFQTVACLLILMMGFGNYKTLLSMLVPMGLVMYIAVLIAVPIMRFRKPDKKRTFKVPFGKIGPVLVVVFLIGLVVLWALNEPEALRILGLGSSLIFIGVPLYFLIELYYDPKMITEVNDLLAYATLFTERVNLPGWVIDEIITLSGDLEGKKVLEFGCGVGTLTVRLAEEVGPFGRVYATSFSRNHLKITERRTSKKSWSSKSQSYGEVELIHDTEHTKRVHPAVGRVDVAVSIGTIGYLQEVEKVLKEVNELMPNSGKICFVDYGDFFHVLPNVDWLSNNDKIEKIFRSCGFSVQVKRRKGLLWNYIFIYGIKFDKDVPFI